MTDPTPLAPRTMAELRGLLLVVAGCELVGLAGVPVTRRSATTWLPTLDLPAYQPPGWVFGPVWTVLYALMGGALDVTRRSRPAGDAERDRAVRLFAVQLACNGLWTYAFFGLRSPRLGFVDAVLLQVSLMLTVRAIWRVSRPAAVLLLPYLAWTTFAVVLTADLARRNPRG
jgi:benzodiazapine receptor